MPNQLILIMFVNKLCTLLIIYTTNELNCTAGDISVLPVSQHNCDVDVLMHMRQREKGRFIITIFIRHFSEHWSKVLQIHSIIQHTTLRAQHKHKLTLTQRCGEEMNSRVIVLRSNTCTLHISSVTR